MNWKETINRIVKLYELVFRFITHDLWHLNMQDFSRAKLRITRYARVVVYTIKKYMNDKMSLRSVAFSFYSVMAFVPFLALLFVITNGFGITLNLEQMILMNFSTNPHVVEMIIQAATKIQELARSGIYGFVSFGMFAWMVIDMMVRVEGLFNEIWKVERSRGIFKRILSYILILIFSPLIVAAFLGTSVYVSYVMNFLQISDTTYLPISSFLTWAVTYGVIFLIFASMYKFVPNTKIPTRSAIQAALLAALAFVVVQFLYVETQMLVSKVNGVYGAFAAIPLFMVWLKIGWTIIFIGAELSYSFKYVNEYSKQGIEKKLEEA